MLMLTDYATVAGHIYNPSEKGFQGVPVKSMDRTEFQANIKTPSSAPLNGWVAITDIDPAFMYETHACFAQLYLKMMDNRVYQGVMAIRGTNAFDNIIADIKTYMFDGVGLAKPGRQLSSSDIKILSNASWDDSIFSYLLHLNSFHHKAVDYMLTNFPDAYMLNGVSVTGHSLGGMLAKMLVLTACIGNTPAVSFNGPGCGNLPNIHPEFFPLIYNVNARYDFVSKVGTPEGHVCWVDVPDHQDGAKQLLADYIAKHPFPANDPDPTKDHPELGNLHVIHVDAGATATNVAACVPTHDEDAERAYASGNTKLFEAQQTIKNEGCVIDTAKEDMNVILAQHIIKNLEPALLNNVMVGTRLVW